MIPGRRSNRARVDEAARPKHSLDVQRYLKDLDRLDHEQEVTTVPVSAPKVARSIATALPLSKCRSLQSMTKRAQTLRITLPLSRRKSAIVLKSGVNWPTSHITRHCA